jgi:hypothetical protein
MTKRMLALAIGLVCALLVPLVLLETALWAAPEMDPERQTVPTPGSPEPIDTPTPKKKKDRDDKPEPPQPPVEPTPTETPVAEPSPTPLPAVPSPTPVPPSPTPLPGWDFGDAPDPGFPSLLESDGARHANVQFEWLGEGVDKEADSRQVDEDLFDDGVAFGRLRTCTETEVRVRVSVQDRNDPDHPYDAEHLLYLNVLADWDGDGWWEGGMSCPNGLAAWEWAVKDQPVDVSSWPGEETYAVVPLTLPVGPRGGETWFRFCLSYGEPVGRDYWDGGGEFAFGETEDHRITVEHPPTPTPGGETPTPPNPIVTTVTRTAETLGIPSAILWGALFVLTAILALGFIVLGYRVSTREGG